MNAMSNMSASQSGVELKKTEIADKKQLDLYKKLYDLREQLFDAPAEVKKDFNKVVKYFSKRSSEITYKGLLRAGEISEENEILDTKIGKVLKDEDNYILLDDGMDTSIKDIIDLCSELKLDPRKYAFSRVTFESNDAPMTALEKI